MDTLEAAAQLRDACEKLDLDAPYVYHPLAYAWEPHARFATRYGRATGVRRRGLLVGMNPGPWGAVQTGVPFGDASVVRDWMGIAGRVGTPPRVHPKRPVLGFAATRRDGSGMKLYGWARERCGTAERFFDEFYVINYCPLAFFDRAGRNITPERLPKSDRDALWPLCDAHLANVARALEPEWLLPLGAFAEARVRETAAHEGLIAPVRALLHPSPANPQNNFGWGADTTFLT